MTLKEYIKILFLGAIPATLILMLGVIGICYFVKLAIPSITISIIYFIIIFYPILKYFEWLAKKI